tara:strand:- start:607 stop:1332 length:726 start_codon:yes stop_codon:yes gene_type:complete
MNYIKKITKNILIIISRIIYWIIPKEFKKNVQPSVLGQILEDINNKEIIETFGEILQKSLIFNITNDLRKYSIQKALENDKNKEYFYLELGVHKGESANFFSKFVKKLYAFDSFEGLIEDMGGSDAHKGYFNLNKKVPRLNSNVEIISGWVEDTLDDFLKKHNPKINFVHMDIDTYTSTKYALEKLKPHLVKSAIIVFDELYNNVGWRHREYKALREVFTDDEYEYRAFSLQDTQAVIQLK